ncbi:hypothetical protein BDQ94DRAFT_155763, partial [Aspergillus welwitschiae]
TRYQPVCCPPLPSVYHGYRLWSARLHGDVPRFPTSRRKIDPFVLALFIHRVIRKVTFDSSLPRKGSVSKTTNSAITRDLCRRLEAGKYARIKQEITHYKAYTPEWRAKNPQRWGWN